MSIRKIKVQKLTREAFAPYGTVVDWPSEQEADGFALRSSDRFDFFPKLGSLACDHDSMQVGIATHYKRPYRTVNMERHYHTEELMVPLTNPIILIFAKNDGLDPNEEPDIDKVEAFLINTTQGVVVNTGVWHWTPFAVGGDSRIICIFAENTSAQDCDVRKFPDGQVLEIMV